MPGSKKGIPELDGMASPKSGMTMTADIEDDFNHLESSEFMIALRVFVNTHSANVSGAARLSKLAVLLTALIIRHTCVLVNGHVMIARDVHTLANTSQLLLRTCLGAT